MGAREATGFCACGQEFFAKSLQLHPLRRDSLAICVSFPCIVPRSCEFKVCIMLRLAGTLRSAFLLPWARLNQNASTSTSLGAKQRINPAGLCNTKEEQLVAIARKRMELQTLCEKNSWPQAQNPIASLAPTALCVQTAFCVQGCEPPQTKPKVCSERD